MPGRSQGRSRRNADTPSTSDRTDRTVSSTFESADVWDGGQIQRTPWFFKKLNQLQESFRFKLFCVSACVSVPNKGQIAVYNVEHAKAHRDGQLNSSIKEPCMWMPSSTTAPSSAPPTSSAPPHGGYPGTPIPTPSAPSYASAAATTGRPPTLLERELGDAASSYIIAPFLCEEVDNDMLEFFLKDVDNERLVKIWRRKCTTQGGARGRTFIKLMMEEISNDELSMTGETTIQSRIDLIVRTGLNEASLQELFYMMDIYETWADALPSACQPNDSKKAHIFQKWVCDLSPSIKVQMQVEMNTMESKALAVGKNLRVDDPIALVTQAATIVLQDEQNEAEIKGIESGRAFFSSKFDARKRPPTRPAPGGQTWAAPTAWQTGMRLCSMCPDGTVDNARCHLDKDCKHATPAKLAEREKAVQERRQKRKAEQEKAKADKGSRGQAKLVSGEAEAVDEADADAANSIFPDDQDGPIILDLSSIMEEGASARSLMAKGAAVDEAPTATAASTSTAIDPTTMQLSSSRIYVVGYSGDDTIDAIDPGIYVGHWNVDVLPVIRKLHLDDQLILDEEELKTRTDRLPTLEAAVARCAKLSVTPEYMGVVALDGLNVGDNVHTYLRRAAGDASDDEPSLYECSSDASSDGEPDLVEAESTPIEADPSGKSGTATNDFAELFDAAPPSQPPSSATKFADDLSTAAASATQTASISSSPMGSPLTMLTEQIEGVTVNTHLDAIKSIIRTHNLPVSPATGGSEARTKFVMINEMRELIGSSPLPVEALLHRRKRPDPVPPVLMGHAVDASEGVNKSKPTAKVIRRCELPSAAKYFRDVNMYHLYFLDDGSPDGITYAIRMGEAIPSPGGRELNFDDAPGILALIPSPRLVYTTLKFLVSIVVTIVRHLVMLMVTLLVSANLWAVFMATYHPSLIIDLAVCHRFAPVALCDMLAPGVGGGQTTIGARGHDPAPPNEITDGTQFSSEPGAPTCLRCGPSQSWPSSVPAEALGLLFPLVICLILVLHSVYATVVYSSSSFRQADGLFRGLGRPQDPPRDINSSSSRRFRQRRRSSSRVASSSRFLSTLGEAPLWLSILLLALETCTFVVPSLAALSIATLAANTLRGIYLALRAVCLSYEMTPIRVPVRFAFNALVLAAYLLLGVVVDTTVSRRPFISAGDVWRHPGLHRHLDFASGSPCADTVTSTIGAALSLFGSSLSHLGTALSRCGGAGSTTCPSSPSPARTDPHSPNYDPEMTTRPRQLHAFNTRKLARDRHERLAAEASHPPDQTTTQRGHALLGRAGLEHLKVSDIAKYICWSVIDSGCSWHCHPHIKDLINRRPCNDTMTGIDGKPQKVTCIGDLPALSRDHLGVWRRIIIRNVRCVPTFGETLISVDQFWQDSQVDTIFNSTRCIVVPSRGDEAPLDLPFVRKELLFKWAFVPTQRHAALEGPKPSGTKIREIASTAARAFKATIHRPNSTSFFTALPPGEMLELLHRRLHIGHDTIRRLGTTSSDVPTSISKAHAPDCVHCKTANATRVPHPGKAYAPSHVGRLIHGDIAGPFKRSQHGFTYFLVLVDDHSRFKQVYFLKNKSDALNRVKSFVAKLNSICNVGKPESERVRIVGQLHLDNAGEFMSREFTEYLDSESITRTTCPPHVHQLNGVAERAIRSIMEIVRATREASACPVSFWPHLVEHSVDVLNRTTGPPHVAYNADGASVDRQCSLEIVTGQKPKILNIMPIGCRAYAVKPPNAYTKSGFESRAWAGICLGRSCTISGAYNIWLPSLQKLIQTSEVYFDESLYPWRPSGDQRIGLPTPTAAPPTDEHDITAGGGSLPQPPQAPSAKSPATDASLPESFASATRAARTLAGTSSRVLLLFSGAYRRPDGLAQFARKLGLEVELFDNDAKTGGGADADITNDDVYDALRERIVRGEFAVILAAPPCSTFSISRFFESKSSEDGGPPIVRTRAEIEGCRFVPSAHRTELERANNIVNRTASLLLLAHRAGTQFIIENPADRGDLTEPKLFLHRDHGPLWLMPAMLHLADKVSAKFVTFAMCAFGAEWQKETTLMYTAGLDAWLDSLRERTCEHSHHAKLAGGDKRPDGWNSNKTAAYPPDLNLFFAQAMANYVRQRQADLSLAPLAPAERTQTHPAVPAETNDPADEDSRPTDPLEQTHKVTGTSTSAATSATSARHLSFDDTDHTDLGDIHEEPDPEELPDLHHGPTPAKKVSKPKVTFEKTAGARGTRSNQPTLLPGLSNSAGFAGMALLALGASLSNAMSAMCSTNLLEELSRPDSSLSVALAKPSSVDPKSQADAYARDRSGWRESEAKELQNHHDNGSWEYIDASQLPRGRRLVKLVWVYKVKRNGSLKSRLCVQGCRQVPGVDYDQTWCGAMRSTSLRLLSNLAANSDMRMRRYDFVAAYLQGELLEGETVFCYPPPGYESKGKDGRNQICRILKPVYGMAQAGRRWQRTLFPWLLEYGFTQSHSDHSVFTLERSMPSPSGPRSERLHVGVYVDDLAIVYGNDDEHSLFRSFVSALEERWKVEDEGELTDLLGIEFARSKHTMELKQTKYIEKLAAEHFPDGIPTTAQQNKVPCDRDLPAMVNIALVNDVAPDAELLRQYQSLCGGLLYASTNTRPDIAFSTGMLCRAMGRPTPELLERSKRVLGYLYRTRHIGLRYEASKSHLEGFSDSDWGVKHSTSGHVFRLGSATISWASKKQPSVALSSCEAEIMAGSEAAKEAIYLSSFLNELGVTSSEPPPLHMDNKSAIDLAYNPEHHARTKHIDRRHYFVRECVEQGRLRVPFVSTSDNIADFFTKPLMGKDFFRLRDIIMNVPHGSSHHSSPST